MNKNKWCFCLAMIISQLFFQVVDAKSRVTIQIPSLQQETDYVWQTIRDIRFFEQHNYAVSLPAGQLIESLLQKSRSNQLTDDDYIGLQVFMQNDVYQAADYLSGSQKINANLPLINRMINQISDGRRNWDFKEFENYQVRLTLYGPGGSFDPDNGSILIFTSPEGGFKQYKNPANIIIHEVVHIGIEHSIVQKHGVPHGLKERIVDTFVLLNFHEMLPAYRKQPMGDQRLDAMLTSQDDLNDLASIIEQFVKN